jgi:glucokinase
MFLGIEIGGTKLQLGLGYGDGTLVGLWRGEVDVTAGPEGIRRQILTAVPELLGRAGVPQAELEAVGIGFGGPVDDATHSIIKSHQIEGWDSFPLADWIAAMLGRPAVLGNDADVAGLAEAIFGAGKGLSPVFYITIGSGIGGGLIIDGEIYRGCGRGAAEIGHLRIASREGFEASLEGITSGWAIARLAEKSRENGADLSIIDGLRGAGAMTAEVVGRAAAQGDPAGLEILQQAWEALAEGVCLVIALLCPRRIVIGGGVSLLGERLLFEPLRQLVAERVFRPFAGCYDIVPAVLGEAVVVHGALALARLRFRTRSG